MECRKNKKSPLSFEKLFCIFGRCHEKCHEITKPMQFTLSCICHTISKNIKNLGLISRTHYCGAKISSFFYQPC